MTVESQPITSLIEVAARFHPGSPIAQIQAFGNGNINRTYKVTPELGAPFLLQRLNTAVFQQPDLVMGNIRAIARHLDQRDTAGDRRWEFPHVLPTLDGADHWRELDGSFWRAQRFIGGSQTVDAIQDPALAREVGHALGTFHALLADMPMGDLADTLPGFHIAPGYLDRFDEVAALVAATGCDEEAWAMGFIAANRDWVPVLEEAREQGRLRVRAIHGDPKVNNILFDAASGRAIAMVDLDTVKPGLVQYDIGDCLRSSCNPDGEETERWRDVSFDLELARAVLEGYLAIARDFFDDADFALLPEAVRLIAFELGLRFFTDHLAGDTYFHVERRGQNLSRALVQFRLAESVHERLDELRAIVEGLR